MRISEQKLIQISVFGLVAFVCLALIMAIRDLDAFDALGIKGVIVLAAAIVFFVLIIGGEDSRRRLLYFGFATIAVGHRALYVGKSTYFVPLEIILWGLFAITLVNAIAKKEREPFGLPALYAIAALWAVIVGIGGAFQSTNSWYNDAILAWTSPLIVGVAAFVVVRRLIRTPDHLRTILNIVIGVSVVMSVLAITEYLFPSVESSLPWLFMGKAALAQDGFRRAAFSFFGYSAAASIVAWGMLVSYDCFFHPRGPVQRIICLAAFFLDGWAVYVSGQRSSWLGLGIALLVLNIPYGIRGVGGVAVIWGIVTQFSGQFWTRVNTVTAYVERGVVLDTSTEQRINRANWAWDTMLEKPLAGGGYGHWLAHNVFLEIGSTIGIIPALGFAGFILHLLWKLIKMSLVGEAPEMKRYGWLFLSLSVLWIVQMSVETVFQTPPFAAPHWAMIAVAWSLPNILGVPVAVRADKSTPQSAVAYAHDYRTSPNL